MNCFILVKGSRFKRMAKMNEQYDRRSFLKIIGIATPTIWEFQLFED